jgi:hypothetical protein
LVIASAIHQSQNREVNRNILTQNNRAYHNRHHQRRYNNLHNRNRNGGSFQHNHGAHGWHYHQKH